MIIDCQNCNKKFDIDQNLIPSEGRLLQCGSCNHKWFFKIDAIEKKNEEKIKINPTSLTKVIDDNGDELPKNEIDSEVEKINPVKKRDKSNTNYLNILLVIIISIIAFVLILDTFKDQLASTIPNINFLLDNLYLSLEDIKLFILDLIK